MIDHRKMGAFCPLVPAGRAMMIWDRLKRAITAFHTILALQWNLLQNTPHPAMWRDMQKIDWLVSWGMLHMWHATSLHKCSKWNKILSGGEIKLCVKTHRSYKSRTLPGFQKAKTGKHLRVSRWSEPRTFRQRTNDLTCLSKEHLILKWTQEFLRQFSGGLVFKWLTYLDCLWQLLCNGKCLSGCQSFPCIHKTEKIRVSNSILVFATDSFFP